MRTSCSSPAMRTEYRRRGRQGVARCRRPGVHWCDEGDLEGCTDVRARQRAGEGVLRDRGPRRVAASGAQQGRRAHPLPAGVRDRRRGRAVLRTSTRRTTTASKTVVLTKEDLASLPAERSREIDVVEFVPSEQVDLLTLDRAYYLEPDSELAEGVRAAAQDARADRPHGDRAVLAAAEDPAGRAAGARRRARAADPAVGRRGARGGVPRARTSRSGSRRRSSSCRHPSSRASRATSIPTEFTDEYQEELRTLIEAKLEQGDALDTSETFGEQRGGGGRRRGHRPHGGAACQRREVARGARGRADRRHRGKKDAAADEKPAAKASAKKPAAKSSAKKPAAKKKAS